MVASTSTKPVSTAISSAAAGGPRPTEGAVDDTAQCISDATLWSVGTRPSVNSPSWGAGQMCLRSSATVVRDNVHSQKPRAPQSVLHRGYPQSYPHEDFSLVEV